MSVITTTSFAIRKFDVLKFCLTLAGHLPSTIGSKLHRNLCSRMELHFAFERNSLHPKEKSHSIIFPFHCHKISLLDRQHGMANRKKSFHKLLLDYCKIFLPRLILIIFQVASDKVFNFVVKSVAMHKSTFPKPLPCCFIEGESHGLHPSKLSIKTSIQNKYAACAVLSCHLSAFNCEGTIHCDL